MKIRLTYRQKEILDFIISYIRERGYSPTIREIMSGLSFASPRAVDYHLEKLEEARLIQRSSEKRGIRLFQQESENNQKTILIPLVGTAPCGGPLWAEQNIEDYYPISNKLIKHKKGTFILKAVGDSMNKEGIESGDLVLVDNQEQAQNGDNIVALLDDSATIKKFYKTDNHVVLKPNSTNPQHKPIILDSDFIIQGKIIDVIKNTDDSERLMPAV